MADQLDDLLRRLGAAPADRSLTNLEVDVQRSVARGTVRMGNVLALSPVRLAAVGAALLLGVGVGGLTAASALSGPAPTLFSAADRLAPSTLLDGGD